MKGFISAVFTAVLLATSVVAQDKPRINSPNGLIQCQPTQLTWSGGVPPYIITILPGGQPSAAPLKTFPKTSATALTWIVDLEPSAITIEITDAQGAQGFTSTVNLSVGTDRSCLGSPTSVIPASGTAAPSASGSGAPGTSATSGSAPAASSTAKPNSASTMAQNVLGAIGFSGLVVAALL